MTDFAYPLFPICAFIGFILSLIPLPWHLEAWNSGTCYYMIWSALACLNQFINAVVWHNNAINVAPVWCDISIRITLGAAVGIPASSLCINRRLYHIASIRAVSMTPSERKKEILIDTAICILFPFVFIALQYIVQGHRFNIFEDIGCYPFLVSTPLTFFINSIWPIILGLISAIYAILSLRCFIRQRAQFSQFLSSNKSITASRYFRLMALSVTEIMCTTPLAIFVIWLDISTQSVQPYINWANVHYNFSRVVLVPTVVWRMDPLLVLSLELSRWAIPFCAFILFAFFGFAGEARKNYRAAFLTVAKHVCLKRSVSEKPLDNYPGSYPKCALISKIGPAGILPTYCSEQTLIETSSSSSGNPKSSSSFEEKNAPWKPASPTEIVVNTPLDGQVNLDSPC